MKRSGFRKVIDRAVTSFTRVCKYICLDRIYDMLYEWRQIEHVHEAENMYYMMISFISAHNDAQEVMTEMFDVHDRCASSPPSSSLPSSLTSPLPSPPLSPPPELCRKTCEQLLKRVRTDRRRWVGSKCSKCPSSIPILTTVSPLSALGSVNHQAQAKLDYLSSKCDICKNVHAKAKDFQLPRILLLMQAKEIELMLKRGIKVSLVHTNTDYCLPTFCTWIPTTTIIYPLDPNRQVS
jgi:hypothetical protein